MRSPRHSVLALSIASLALIGASLSSAPATSDVVLFVPDSDRDTVRVDGVLVRAEAEAWVDRMPAGRTGCGGSGPTSFLVVQLRSTGPWPAGVEPMRLWAMTRGRYYHREAVSWEIRHESGGTLILRDIPGSWTTLDVVVELLSATGELRLAVRAVPVQATY